MLLKYFFDHWDEIEKRIRNKHIILFLDYDGTLSPIVEKPQDAVLPAETKEILEKLSTNSLCSIAIVSGRALDNVKKYVNINSVQYIGNHGLEIEGYDIAKQVDLDSYKSILPEIRNSLQKELAIPGIILENKGITLSVHYRQVAEEDVLAVKTLIKKITASYEESKKIIIKEGKKVFEVRPPVKWNKGYAVDLIYRSLQKKQEIIPFYFGDDTTDEDAFCVLAEKGVTVFVGEKRETTARYYVNNTEEVRMSLFRIEEMLTENGDIK